MKTLVEITTMLEVNAREATATRSNYEQRMKDLAEERTQLLTQRNYLLSELNLDKIKIAESILDIQGDIANSCEGAVLAELAAKDIAAGCSHLKREYYGNKRYDGFYQRCDCEYGYGPKHGSIVERVGLNRGYRCGTLTAIEAESCVYYLLNFRKIRSSKRAAVNDVV